MYKGATKSNSALLSIFHRIATWVYISDQWFDSKDLETKFQTQLSKKQKIRIRAANETYDTFATAFDLTGSTKALDFVTLSQFNYFFQLALETPKSQ